MANSIQKVRAYTFEDPTQYSISEDATTLSPLDGKWELKAAYGAVEFRLADGARPYLFAYTTNYNMVLTFADQPAIVRMDAAIGFGVVSAGQNILIKESGGDYDKLLVKAGSGRIINIAFDPPSHSVGPTTLILRKLEAASDFEDEFGD